LPQNSIRTNKKSTVKVLSFIGAPGQTRTGTPLLATDFKADGIIIIFYNKIRQIR
jgi:hypothetical protein